MSEGNESDGQAAYQIRVQGKLDERWADWFNGVTIMFESGITTLTGTAVDQARLRGILSKIWDLNLMLLSVNRIESEESESHPQQIIIPSEPTHEVKEKQGGESNGKTSENSLA